MVGNLVARENLGGSLSPVATVGRYTPPFFSDGVRHSRVDCFVSPFHTKNQKKKKNIIYSFPRIVEICFILSKKII